MEASGSGGALDIELRAPRDTGTPHANRRHHRRDSAAAAAFLTPSLLAFTLFVILPALAAVGLSFYSWDLFHTPKWVGLTNYAHLWHDKQVWISLRVTVEFIVLGVVPTILLGFMLAVLINSKMRGIGGLRILYFAPMLASSAVAAVLWSYMYDPRSGIANRALGWLGFGPKDWLTDPTWALPALVLMLIWLALPLVMILYLAALQRIPDDLYDAATLDGAGIWRALWSITWPNVKPMTILVAVLQVINFASSSFEVSLIMTNGGPLNHTETLTLYAYKTAFGSDGPGDLGYASALSIFQVAILGVAVAVAAAKRARGRAA